MVEMTLVGQFIPWQVLELTQDRQDSIPLAPPQALAL